MDKQKFNEINSDLKEINDDLEKVSGGVLDPELKESLEEDYRLSMEKLNKTREKLDQLVVLACEKYHVSSMNKLPNYEWYQEQYEALSNAYNIGENIRSKLNG